MIKNFLQEKDENSFVLNVELKELSVNGVVKFYPTKRVDQSLFSWNNQTLTIPIYGVYKITWGFYQNAVNTFYKDSKTELELVINDDVQTEKANINIDTPSFHALKASHQTVTLLLRENEKLSLNAVFCNAKNLNMKDIYFKVFKLNMEENTALDY